MLETKLITDKRGRTIELRAEMDYLQISAYHEKTYLGQFEFEEHEGPEGEMYLHVLSIFLEEHPGYRGCHIGLNIIRWAEELSGMLVTFGRDDGYESPDGSHLIGDGPGFANAIYRRRAAGDL